MLRPTLWVHDPRLPDQRPLPLSLGNLARNDAKMLNAETESSAGTASQGNYPAVVVTQWVFFFWFLVVVIIAFT